MQLLSSLHSRGISVRAEEGVLVCSAPKGALTPELCRQLARCKAELLELLGTGWRSVVAIQPHGARPPLFGVHSTRYRTLAAHLDSDQPLYALRYGLARTRVPPPLPARLEDLAAHYVEEMRGVQPRGPYHLMGLCVGGIIAFEMAHLLLDQGEQVGLLALVDTPAPGAYVPLPTLRKLRNLLRSPRMPGHARSAIRSRFRRATAVQRNHIAQHVYRDFAPHRVYPGDVELFRPADRISLTQRIAPDLGWGALVEGELVVHDLPGRNHTALFAEPQVETLAELLKGALPAPKPASQ